MQKKHSLSHQLTAQLHKENSKNKKMVIKLLQQSTFRRYAAIVLSPFFLFLLFSLCNCAVNWCDKLCFLHLLNDNGYMRYSKSAICTYSIDMNTGISMTGDRTVGVREVWRG